MDNFIDANVVPLRTAERTFGMFNAAIDHGLAGLLTKREWACFTILWRLADRQTRKTSLGWFKPPIGNNGLPDYRPSLCHLQAAAAVLRSAEYRLLEQVEGEPNVYRMPTAEQIIKVCKRLKDRPCKHFQIGSERVGATSKLEAGEFTSNSEVAPIQIGTEFPSKPEAKPLPIRKCDYRQTADQNTDQNTQKVSRDVVAGHRDQKRIEKARSSMATTPQVESIHHEGIAIYKRLWEDRYPGRKFEFPKSKAALWGKAFKQLLDDCHHDAAEFERRAKLFFSDPKPFFGADESHPPTKFLTHITRYQGFNLPEEGKFNVKQPGLQQGTNGEFANELVRRSGISSGDSGTAADKRACTAGGGVAEARAR